MVKKYSDLQRSALKLYRDYLKFGCSKPEPLRSNIINYASSTFRKHRDIPRTKFDRIEFLMRQESNKLDMWKEANIEHINFKPKD